MVCDWRGFGCTHVSCEKEAYWQVEVAPEPWNVCDTHLGPALGFVVEKGLSARVTRRIK